MKIVSSVTLHYLKATNAIANKRSLHHRLIQSCYFAFSNIPLLLLLLLLLSRFSRVRLCATPQTAAHQAPPSLGFSWQEHWSGLPFPAPMYESEKWVKSLSRVRLLATPWTAVYQAPPSMGFSRQEYWSGVPSPSPQIYHYKFQILSQKSRECSRLEFPNFWGGGVGGYCPS